MTSGKTDVTLQLDFLERRIDRIEERLEKINISEVIVKGRELLKIYKRLEEIGVIRIHEVENKLNELARVVRYIQYHPWEWLQRDPVAKQSFFVSLRREIANEVSQAALFTIYEEQPNVVIKIVKDAVRQYLGIWEVNDQIAEQLVAKVIKNKYLMYILQDLRYLVETPQFRKEFLRMTVDQRKIQVARTILEEDW